MEEKIIIEGLVELLVPLTAIITTMAMIVAVVYFVSRHKFLRRKLEIEHGLASEVPQRSILRGNGLDFTLAAIGFGLGLFVADLMGYNVEHGIVFWALPIMLGGLFLGLSFMIKYQFEQREKEQKPD